MEHDLALSHRGYLAYAFAIPLVVAALLEGLVAARSDFLERKKLMAAAQAALALALTVAGWTASAWGLALALAFAGTASGVACGAAQALLLAEHASADRAMVRWSLFSSIGDVLTPLFTAALLASGRSYRSAMLVVAAVVALQCVGSVASARSSVAVPLDDDDPAEPILRALSRAARMPGLWAWLLASASCTLLDELVIALAALRLVRAGRWSEGGAALAVAAFSVGAVGGGVLSDRAVDRFGPRRVLLASGLAALVGLGALVLAPNAVAVVVALFALGTVVAPHHPLTLARAYETLPRAPGTIQALLQPFAAVDVLAPIVLGAVADRFGLTAALAGLALQPTVIVAVALVSRGETKERPR